MAGSWSASTTQRQESGRASTPSPLELERRPCPASWLRLACTGGGATPRFRCSFSLTQDLFPCAHGQSKGRGVHRHSDRIQGSCHFFSHRWILLAQVHLIHL